MLEKQKNVRNEQKTKKGENYYFSEMRENVKKPRKWLEKRKF